MGVLLEISRRFTLEGSFVARDPLIEGERNSAENIWIIEASAKSVSLGEHAPPDNPESWPESDIV